MVHRNISARGKISSKPRSKQAGTLKSVCNSRTEEILREKEERYRRVFENSQLGIVIFARNGKIMEVNQTFRAMTDYSLADMRRLSLADIIHPEHLTDHRKMMRAVRLCNQGNMHLEQRLIRKYGEVIWADIHIGAVCDADDRPLYFQALIADITDRRLIRAELEERNRRILESQRTIQKLKDEFIFIAAHELRTPVTAIGWSLDLLQDWRKKRGVFDEELTEALDVMGQNVNRLRDLVSELLETSRLESGTFRIIPVKFALGPVIDRALAAVWTMAEEKLISVRAESLPKNFPSVFADPIRVNDVLVNLLTNAVKYSLSGGSVTVRAVKRPKDILISVEDTGIGLAADDMPHLFQRFSRIQNTDTRNIEGTGLGLFIVRQAVERMGGRIWAESAGRMKGSTFIFTLPRVQ
jgi:PAS domain S-box-containing protein